MFFVTDPSGILIGVRNTRREANALVESHAVDMLKRQYKDMTDGILTTLADPGKWQRTIEDYKIENIDP